MSWSDIFAFESPSANHHLLNTALTKLAAAALGTSKFALRLPNVLAHVLFLGVAVALVGRLRDRWLRVTAFLLIIANPYVLDFFSLSRGYGLALGFSLSSLLLLVRFAERARRADATLSVLAAAAATLANFSFLYLYAALLAALAVMAMVHHHSGSRDARRWVAFSSLAISLALATLIVRPIFRLVAESQLYYGSERGLLGGTLPSLVESSLYGRFPSGSPVSLALQVVVAAILAALVARGLLRLRRRGLGAFLELSVICIALLLFFVVLQHLSHVLFGTKYLMARTALFLVPIFALALTGALDRAAETRPRTVRLVAAVVSLSAVINWAAAANLSHTVHWRYGADVESMLADLEAEARSRAPDRKVILTTSWLAAPAIEFYRRTRGLEWIAKVDSRRSRYRERCARGCDFVYLVDPVFDDWADPLETLFLGQLEVIHAYSTSASVLLRDDRERPSPSSPGGGQR